MRRCSLMVVGLLVFAGCADRPAVDVRMVHSPTLVPASAFSRLTIRLLSADDGALVSETQIEARGFMAGEVVDDLSRLTVGERLVAEIRAEAEGTCRSGRAVGRSLPFEHRDGDYVVPVHVGCADELFALRDPIRARIGHAVVATPDGGALIGGGGSFARTIGGQVVVSNLIPIVDRYDPMSGGFVGLGGLTVPRATAAAVATPDGVGWIGGTAEGGAPACTSSIELSVGSSTSPGSTLAEVRCGASAAHLPEGDVTVVVGGSNRAADRTTDIEVHSSDLRERISSGHEDLLYRVQPEVVPLFDGRSALVVGGQRSLEPAAPVILSVCDAGVCRASAPSVGLPDGWRELAATHVSCEDGGGVVYATGGASATASLTNADDGIYCMEEGARIGTFRRIGVLPEARRAHRMALVRGSRLLVVGGFDDEGAPHTEALLMQVDPCVCRVDTLETIPVPLRGILATHSMTVLADGAVLIVGGVLVQPGTDPLELDASGDAALFVPDLE